MGEITQYDMRIYQGVAGRGGSPYGEQASFTLMKATGEEEAVKEPETMEPDAEIPKEEPTEPEPIVEAETVSEAPPEEEPIPEEAPSEEAAPLEEAAPEEEESEPEPVVEEEPTVEEALPPEPEPESKDDGVTFVFNPETPHLMVDTESVIVQGQISGITEPMTEKFYVSVVRKGDNGITIPVTDTKLRPEGARTATSHSLVSNPQAF